MELIKNYYYIYLLNNNINIFFDTITITFKAINSIFKININNLFLI